jgi:biopolymer transport protein ExbB
MKCEMWNVRCGVASLVLAASLATMAPLSYAQQNADIDAVKQRAALNSAKADLEEARKKTRHGCCCPLEGP